MVKGYMRNNWSGRFHQKVKPSAKIYDRKKERRINRKPK